jgi:hypothetical protein
MKSVRPLVGVEPEARVSALADVEKGLAISMGEVLAALRPPGTREQD